VDGGVMTATGYNDYLARMARRIGESLSEPLTSSSKTFANISAFPFLQVNLPQLTGWVDEFIRRRLFDAEFDPHADENWRVLRLDPVASHIIRAFGRKLPELTEVTMQAPMQISHRLLSEVDRLTMRAEFSIPVEKCIYERLPFPSRNGELEKAFIEKSHSDATVLAFCKINEQKHTFLRLRYVKESGLPGFYWPDYLVRTATAIYLAETKGQTFLALPDVERKRKAAVAWCDRTNELPADQRDGKQWSYALVGEDMFYSFENKGASLEEILDFARLRSKAVDKEALL